MSAHSLQAILDKKLKVKRRLVHFKGRHCVCCCKTGPLVCIVKGTLNISTNFFLLPSTQDLPCSSPTPQHDEATSGEEDKQVWKCLEDSVVQVWLEMATLTPCFLANIPTVASCWVCRVQFWVKDKLVDQITIVWLWLWMEFSFPSTAKPTKEPPAASSGE